MSHERAPVLAIDIGGTKTSVAAVRDLPSDGLRPLRRPVRFATPRDAGLFPALLGEAAGRVLPDGVLPAAVGIGLAAPFDRRTGSVEHFTNLGWRHVPLGPLVSDRFEGVPTVIDDDANTGALGEALAGAGRGADPFVYLSLGTGLGAGIIIGGEVVSGAHGAAGEVGHMAVHGREGPRCACGRRGCVEVWCSGIGLARRARETWPAARLSDGTVAPRDAAGVFALARTGDADAARLVAQAAEALAVAIAALIASLDPAVISVGGTMGLAEPAFVGSAFRAATRLVWAPRGRGVKLRRPRLVSSSVLAGAAVLAVRARPDG